MRDSITFRPQREEDVPFLFVLYASTRAEEMRIVPWTDEQKQQFLEMQFRAQTIYYAEEYDGGEFLVIEQDGRPIGRLYIDRTPEDFRVVDIALMPETRGKGLGTILLKEIMDEAASKGAIVSIHVEHFNPALRLYQRLGFEHVDTNGVYHLMTWKAPEKRVASRE